MPTGRSRMSRVLRATVLSIAALTFTAGAALGHECVNESRSARGDAKAAAGNGWTLTSDVVFQFVLPDFTGVTLTPAQLATAQAMVVADKASGQYDALYVKDRAILDHATAMNGNSRDGHGPKSSDNHAIDHVTADLAELDALLGRLTEIFFAAAAS